MLEVCKNGRDEVNLIVRIQNFVSADMELLKSGAFRDVVNILYQKDVLSEDTILMWYRYVHKWAHAPHVCSLRLPKRPIYRKRDFLQTERVAKDSFCNRPALINTSLHALNNHVVRFILSKCQQEEQHS